MYLQRKIQTFGSHGTANYIRFAYYSTLANAAEDLRKQGFKIVGLEIAEGAVAVSSFNFPDKCALLLGNEVFLHAFAFDRSFPKHSLSFALGTWFEPEGSCDV
jgi:hypothetical protein